MLRLFRGSERERRGGTGDAKGKAEKARKKIEKKGKGKNRPEEGKGREKNHLRKIQNAVKNRKCWQGVEYTFLPFPSFPFPSSLCRGRGRGY